MVPARLTVSAPVLFPEREMTNEAGSLAAVDVDFSIAKASVARIDTTGSANAAPEPKSRRAPSTATGKGGNFMPPIYRTPGDIGYSHIRNDFLQFGTCWGMAEPYPLKDGVPFRWHTFGGSCSSGPPNRQPIAERHWFKTPRRWRESQPRCRPQQKIGPQIADVRSRL